MDRADIALAVSILSLAVAAASFGSHWFRGRRHLRLSAERGLWSGPDKDWLLVKVHNDGAHDETVVLTGLVNGGGTYEWRGDAEFGVALNRTEFSRLPIDEIRDRFGKRLARRSSVFVVTASGKRFSDRVARDALLSPMEEAFDEAKKELHRR